MICEQCHMVPCHPDCSRGKMEDVARSIAASTKRLEAAAAILARQPTPDQLAEGFISQSCQHCGVTMSGQHRRIFCGACGKGYAS